LAEGGLLLLARLILASLAADFLFQSSAMAQAKQKRLSTIGIHSGIVVLLSFFASIDFFSAGTVVMVLLLGGIHFLIDWGKVSVDRRLTDGYWPATTFLLDQLLHLVVITSLLVVFNFLDGTRVIDLLWAVTGDSVLTAIAAVYVGALFGGSVLVRMVVQSFGTEVTKNTGLAKAGAYIGVLERFLLISLLGAGQFGAAGLVLVAKSIARYKQLDDQDFAEYFLIGTLTSLVIAVLAGMVVRRLVGMYE
jgi:hypothetical protein